MKNYTHLELGDGVDEWFLKDLRDVPDCKSPLLGDSVSYVNFTNNHHLIQYRAAGIIEPTVITRGESTYFLFFFQKFTSTLTNKQKIH
jgi:hypothetical protein